MEQTLFDTNYRHRQKFHLLNVQKGKSPIVDVLTTRLLQLHETMKLQLQETQSRYKTFANEYNKKQP